MPKKDFRPKKTSAGLVSSEGDQQVNAWAVSLEARHREEPEDPSMMPLLVREPVAARMLNVSKRYVAQLEKAGHLRCRRLGRCKLYSVAALKAFAERGGV
jgi:hypothetical protein